ncbi:aspartyl/asparaginyl beta-hydroxylase isoform X1 [Pimephales promelas]|uniref:aspartyl/asparaginyl beta-hydroxylase isoform X1 n=1 Tax=Pimephales promelas TaxID=90988 RepID=UPI0019555AD9|nr:aspartyl/asparaginyl beta-hydroxylase isoform X1 [Pimephales promelas]XP_039529076.1 aspartyl/asparaginyl beta-hydroxylase isoform X1 [Pimephales promelas]KAG1927022.1 aspartyl/asparaginyl beta-hydroxylase [Pimephales promelas]
MKKKKAGRSLSRKESPVGNTVTKSAGNSFFSWLLVLALLGAWLSVGIVWFDLADYNSVVGALGRVYDADGDGDFDVEDAKVLLGLTEKPGPLASSRNALEEQELNAEFLPGENKDSPHKSTPNADPSLELSGSLTPESPTEAAGLAEPAPESSAGKEAIKKKPKLLNKFDKTIKSEINAAEKLRKKGKVEESLRAFEALVQKYPHSPRSRYGKAQAEDDTAEKKRSNELLLTAVNTYREAADLPDAPPDLVKASLKRRADRQQFLGRTRGSLATLEKLVQIFPEDISLKNDLGVAHLLLGDNKSAKRIYEEVLAAAPHDGFAKVHYGFILKSENKIAESIPYLREGLESGEPGTDDGRFYFHLGDALQRTGDESAYEWYETGHRRGHFASVWQRSLYNVPGLRAQPWWTPEDTGYTDLVKVLERNWLTIRDEALSVLDGNSGQFLPEDENLREKGDWGQFTLWQQGRKTASACRSVPKTCALLERYPEATGCKRGQIKFSVMQPGTHVWPHTGPTNCRLRMHLGLIIPPSGCRIRCTNQTREWEEGKVLIFDDSFEHEVWQEADRFRLIFIVDVWHPELSQSQRQTLSPI